MSKVFFRVWAMNRPAALKKARKLAKPRRIAWMVLERNKDLSVKKRGRMKAWVVRTIDPR